MHDDQGEAERSEPNEPDAGANQHQQASEQSSHSPRERPEQRSSPAPETGGQQAEQTPWFQPQTDPYAGQWGGSTQQQGVQSDARVAGVQQPAQPSGNWWEQAPPAPNQYQAAVQPHVPAQPLPEYEGYGEEEAKDAFSFWRWLWEGSILVVLAFIIAFVIKSVVVQPFYIPSGSMQPTLMPGDRVLVSKFIYRFRQPEAGDIVVFAAPHDAQERDFIKRIIAVEGQTVEIRDGKVYVDGKLQADRWSNASQDHSTYGPVTLEDNNVFVMGDNRSNSSDSRVFGPFNRDRILGEAFVTYWPFTRLRTL